MMIDGLYREVLLDHHRHPRGRHELARVDARADGYNPACGDEVQVRLELDHERILDVAVHSRGCAISVASGSMLAELVRGRTIEQANRITAALTRMLRGETEGLELERPTAPQQESPPASDRLAGKDDWDDLEALAGVRRLPARVKCAALPWMTLLEALDRPAADGETSSARGAFTSTEHGAWDHGVHGAPDRSRGARAARKEPSDAADR